MSDVIISRRGNGKSGNHRFVTEYLCFNHNYVVPEGIVNNEIKVTIIGAGGSSTNNSRSSCGGSGYFNNGTIKVRSGEVIPVSVGTAIITDTNMENTVTGGTTCFGTYLSAEGGRISGGSGGYGGNGYQFGGGSWRYGGNGGGPYGGGGSSMSMNYNGGDGGIYGGGGGGYAASSSNAWAANHTRGGNGGTYGGGGGSGSSSNDRCIIGVGGTYGGNGGAGEWYNASKRTYIRDINAENGTNTMSYDNIPIEFRGAGLAGVIINGKGGAGGGGFGGNGGAVNSSTAGGGGGGYGSNGGWAGTRGGGGGGGYGGDGGNNCGGGGGYGKQSIGGDGGISWFVGGGGGYYCPAGGIRAGNNQVVPEHIANNLYGCGGGLGIFENNILVASFGSGGIRPILGEPGICIIQYYI